MIKEVLILNGYQCPFCQHMIPNHEITMAMDDVNIYTLRRQFVYMYEDYQIKIIAMECPNCEKVTFIATYSGNKMPKDKKIPIYPISEAKQFPDYIPIQIRQDYEEAYAILNLSPKASATLSRRCLQGMIRDFWGVKKHNLAQEIDALKDVIPAHQFAALNALRQLGNIGAHMEADVNTIVDIDTGEAEKLVKLIELLLKQWYVERYEQQKLYEDIIKINDTKQTERH